MRLTRILFVSALAMVTGCGGCDSCFGSAQPGDDAAATIATTTSTPRALAPAADAGDAAPLERDAAKDSAPEPPPEPALTASSLPRPKAPMPLGAFQTCGVYDGPRCEQACLKGACRQECDGVECELTCNGGYCSQLCGPAGKCTMSCNGGHCVQSCAVPENCTKSCKGGSCE